MIASGAVFAALRSRMLSAIPEASVAKYGSDSTFGDWLQKGTFNVSSCTPKSIVLECCPSDFGNVLLIEAENLTNNCFEHFRELKSFCDSPSQRSDAWGAVTAYYLGFFSASALSRLLGSPAAFIDRKNLRTLHTLAQSSSKPPSQGCYGIALGKTVSATLREIEISTAERVHDATWTRILSELDHLTNSPDLVLQTQETEFYSSICTRAFFSSGVGWDWPSFIRNRVNYRAGFAYKLSANTLALLRALTAWRSIKAEEVFETVHKSYRSCSSDVSKPENQIGMMVCVAVSVFLIMRELHRDLLRRRSIDPRWEMKRRRFSQEYLGSSNDFALLSATLAR